MLNGNRFNLSENILAEASFEVLAGEAVAA